MASTGDRGRRAFLRKASAAVPLIAAGAAGEAADYASAAEVFASVDRLEREVDACLGALAAEVPAAGAFAASVARDRLRHRRERARLGRALGLARAAAEAATEAGAEPGLDALRRRQEALVHAHAEGLPALRDRRAVDVLGAHMVDLARHLAVIQLWIEQEEDRG